MRERLELWSASIPFKVKLGLVWAVIALILVFLFSLADFDVEWMIDHLWFITQGLPWTIIICGLAIILAVTLALFGALGVSPTVPWPKGCPASTPRSSGAHR